MIYAEKEYGKALSVLLVEDNPADARLLVECMRDSENNLDFIRAGSLSEALERLSTGEFDVILLDLSLPDAQGLEGLLRICELFPEVPVVVLTGLDDRDVAVEGLRSGAQDYIVKGRVDCEMISRSIRYAVERTAMTRAMRENEERLRILFECMPDPVLIADPDTGYIIDANPAATKLFGRTIEEIRGLHQSGLHPPSVAEDMKRAFCDRMRELQGQGHTGPVEVPVMRPDGSIRTVEIRDELLRLRDRTVVQAIFRDTTERKRYEEALRESREGLANAQRLARLGSWDWDIVTNDLYWSEEIYRIFGVDKESFGATYDAFLGFVHPDDRESVDGAVEKAHYEGRPYSIDHRIVLPDGTVRIVHEQAEMEFDESGKPARMSGTVQDITERKAAEQKIQSLNRELERKVEQLEATVRELEAFNYSVSHDLGAPLRIIDGFSRILLEDYSDTLDEDGKKYLSTIRKNTERMKDFIADLLELARIESFKVEFGEVDMKGLADSVYRELESMTPGKAADLVIGDLPPALGSETLLRQVFVNLISNAIKFTRTTEDARIELGWDREGTENVYRVRDNGVGFDPKNAGRIFDVFERAHSFDEFEGTGVGLAIVQRIVQRHGGRVWAEASPGKGATIGFTLPRPESVEEA